MENKPSGGRFIASLLFFAMTAAIAVLLLLTALGQVKLTWCAPWGEASQLFTLFPALLLPSAALCLPRTPDGGRLPWAMLAVLALAPAAFAVVTSGCLSPQVAQADALPFYTLAKSLSLLSVMERLEPLVSAVLYLSFFALAALQTQSCAALFCGGLRRSDAPRWLAPGICALALAFGWLACPLPGWLSGGGAGCAKPRECGRSGRRRRSWREAAGTKTGRISRIRNPTISR